MTHTLTRISLATLALLAVAVALTASPATAAKGATPCWKTLINDWFDGRIDGTYPIPCYRDAIRHLPTDVKSYSSAREDINQALQLRLTQGSNPDSDGGDNPTTTGGKTNTKPGGGDDNGGDDDNKTGTPGGKPGNGNDGGPGDQTAGGPDGGNQPGNSIPTANSADSVPLPLIILGALAALLMAAGATGFIARRVRTRRLELAAATAVVERARETPPPGR